ncbi:MAG: hypothetical protein HQL50_15400 [Magnetococcales bacterium]|nr:hypothetical protein [Magnetococcales bacterium]
MMQKRPENKPELIRYLLESEGRVMLYLDATHTGVEAPRRFRNDIGLRLILNRTMPHPIEFKEHAIESELRFGGIPHYCILPYDAIWGALNPDTGNGTLWPESMPEPIRKNYQRSQSMFPNVFTDTSSLPTSSAMATGEQEKERTAPTPRLERFPGVVVAPTKKSSPKPGPTLTVVKGGMDDGESEEPPPDDPPPGKRPHLKLVK